MLAIDLDVLPLSPTDTGSQPTNCHSMHVDTHSFNEYLLAMNVSQGTDVISYPEDTSIEHFPDLSLYHMIAFKYRHENLPLKDLN